MKKALSLLLAAVALISLLSLTSCSRADIDLRNKDNIYSDLESMIKNSADYAGQTVALSAECVAIYNFSTNKSTFGSIDISNRQSLYFNVGLYVAIY